MSTYCTVHTNIPLATLVYRESKNRLVTLFVKSYTDIPLATLVSWDNKELTCYFILEFNLTKLDF